MSKLVIDKFLSPKVVGDFLLSMYFNDSIEFVKRTETAPWDGKWTDLSMLPVIEGLNNFLKDSFWSAIPLYVADEQIFEKFDKLFPNTKILSRTDNLSHPITRKKDGFSLDLMVDIVGSNKSLTVQKYTTAPLEALSRYPFSYRTTQYADLWQIKFLVYKESWIKDGVLSFPETDFVVLQINIVFFPKSKKVEFQSFPSTVRAGSADHKNYTSLNGQKFEESENNPFLPPDGGTSGGGGSGGGGGGGQGGDFGPSGQGGGGGSFDNTTEPIPVPSVPPVSAVTSGFITLFNPSLSELRDLCSYLWSDLFDIATWKKLFADPMDAILGLSLLPVTVPNGGAAEVKVGNISTGVSMTRAASQYVVVDCGSVKVDECWGAYLDYEPYTKAEVYLPFIGTHQLAIDDIMSKTVQIVYNVDILTGACYCFIKCDGSVLYNFQGSCAIPIPVTSANYTSMIASQISIAGSIGSLIASSGAVAPAAVSNIASAAVNTLKPNIQKSGSLSGSGGLMGIRKPYLILTRPKQAVAKSQNAFMGYPSFITAQLNTISGWTQVESVNLSGIPCTEFELSEIEKLLKEGVIL